MAGYYQPNNYSTVYNSTDNLNNILSVSVNGNTMTILDQVYVLPNPVLYKQQTNLPNTLIYVTSSLNGLVQQTAQVSVSVNAINEIIPLVTINYYYYNIPNQTVFSATSVQVLNNQLVATLDASTINQTQYIGSNFTLQGNILVGSTYLSPTNYTTTTGTTSASAITGS